MNTRTFPAPGKLALAIALALGGPAAQAAVDCSVTVGPDNGAGDTLGTLSWAIMTANNGSAPNTPYPNGHPGHGCPGDVITLKTDVTVQGVMKRLIDSDVTLQSDATTRTIGGGNALRPMFVKSGRVTIRNLKLNNGRAQGGTGGDGGGGAGLGGALFIYDGSVTVEAVNFNANNAIGGTTNSGGMMGGGGMFGSSGASGGGLFGNGSLGDGGYGGTGAYGGFGGTRSHPSGGFGGGAYGSFACSGSRGGFGGGAGANNGLGGGFGGGGGIVDFQMCPNNGGSSQGGFGGGGGYNSRSYGRGGFGGGNAAASNGARGGGGGGLGGAIFVKRGTLALKDVNFSANGAVGGLSVAPSNNGAGLGGAIFICTSSESWIDCSGTIDEANSYRLTFDNGTAAEGQPNLFWTQRGHSTAGIGDKGRQSIAFGAAPSVSVDGTGTVLATDGGSGNPITFTSQTTGTCTINGSLVTGVTAGPCTIAANQAGDANYIPAAQIIQTFNIGLGTQTIGFAAAPSVAVNTTGTVSATGGASGKEVTFTSQTTGTCTINGSLVTGVTAGTCTIAANQAGNGNYQAAAQALQTFDIGLGAQTIGFGAAPTVAVDTTGTVSATGGGSVNPVIFTSQTTGTCTIDGSLVTGITAGPCAIAANQASDVNYQAAPQALQTFNIGLGTQTIAFGIAPSLSVGGTGMIQATGGASSKPVTFTSRTTGVCTTGGTNGATVTGLTAGTCTIAADQAGDANYNAAAQVTQSFSIGIGSQTITFGAAPAVAVGGTGPLSATGGGSGNPVIFSSLTATVCRTGGTNGSTVTGVAAGTCTIAATQAGNANYNAAAPATKTFSIGKGTQTIAFGTAPSVSIGGTGSLSATGGASGNPVTFASQTAGVCTAGGANGSTVTGIAKGTCTIAANQAGTTDYQAASQATQSFLVSDRCWACLPSRGGWRAILR